MIQWKINHFFCRHDPYQNAITAYFFSTPFEVHLGDILSGGGVVIGRHRMGEFRSEISHGKPKVLMVCIHNSARSQMADAWINHLFGDRVEAESAGLQPGVINPMAVRAMQEKGIDISGAKTRDVFELVRSGHSFSHVVTVCDEVSAEKCPPFRGVEHVQHWDLPDPAAQTGDEAVKMNRFRQIRDELRRRIEEWMAGLNV